MYSPFNFGLSHVLGPVYGVEGKEAGAELIFDGDQLLVAVGNRLNLIHLRLNKMRTLTCENRANVAHLALSPDGRVLISADTSGQSLLISMPRGVEVGRYSFRGPVTALAFSPDSRWLMVAVGRVVEVYRTPAVDRKQFSPLVKYRTITGAFDDVVSLAWSKDSMHMLLGSRDMTVRVHTLKKTLGFRPGVLGGHRDFIVAAAFDHQDKTVAYTVSRDGKLCKWQWEHVPAFLEDDLAEMDDEDDENGSFGPSSDDESSSSSDSDGDDPTPDLLQGLSYGRWRLAEKLFFNAGSGTANESGGRPRFVTAAKFHARGILVVGFSDGLFALYSLDTMENIHSLLMGSEVDGLGRADAPIQAIGVNGSGDWLAFGSSLSGQLLVWEWQSETYIYKQQAHSMGIRRVSYSPDGRLLVTGGQDGKIKLWDAASGACFVTFSEHKGPVTDVLFNSKGNAVFSSSMDGTIRGFDLTRYRNFRVISAANPVQFSCLAMDPSGEILCAGTVDDFSIYVFNVQTGEQLETLSGHQAPVSRVLFSPVDPVLASCGWDGTVRLHSLYARGQGAGSREVLRHGETGRDVVCAAFRRDGLELVVGLLDGSLHFWDPKEVQETGIIDGRHDIWAGRDALDFRAAGRQSSHFESVAYGSGGESVLAVANGSKWVLMYGTRSKTLLKRFCISQNVTISGVLEVQNGKLLTDFGPTAEVAPSLDAFLEKQLALPGVTNAVSRDICVSPSGDEWAALSPEGVHVFRRDHTLMLDAPGLSLGDTPDAVRRALEEGDLTRAVSVAMGLESSVVPDVLHCVPVKNVSLVASALPLGYLPRLLSLLAQQISSDRPQIHLSLHWIRWIMGTHAILMNQEFARFREPVMAVQRALIKKNRSLAGVTEGNLAMLSYLIKAPVQPEDDAGDADGEIDAMEIEQMEVVPLFREEEKIAAGEAPMKKAKKKKTKKQQGEK